METNATDLQTDLVNSSKLLSDQVDTNLETIKSKVIGKDATINAGRYKGRIGQCEDVTYSTRQGIIFLVRPYQLDSHGNVRRERPLLWDHVHARTYWPIDLLTFEH